MFVLQPQQAISYRHVCMNTYNSATIKARVAKFSDNILYESAQLKHVLEFGHALLCAHKLKFVKIINDKLLI